MNNYLAYALGLVMAMLFQVLLFNHLSLFGGVALVYMVALVKMPRINRIAQIVLGFVVGFIIDMFCNTHGMHALTGVTIMLLRDPILNLFIQTEQKITFVNASQMGLQSYMRYSLTMFSIFVLLLYLIEAFTIFNFFVLLLKAFFSVLLTWCFGILWEITTLRK